MVDAALYGSILRTLEWTVAGHDRLGIVRDRQGNRLANSAPLDNYTTADGRTVCIVAGSDANFRRLCRAMGRPELADDPRWATLKARADDGDAINGLVADWVAQQSAREVEEVCVANGVPVGLAYGAADMKADPHMAARGDLVEVDDPVAGPHLQQAPYPRLDGAAPPAPTPAPSLGQHNEDIFCGLLGLDAQTLAGHRAARGSSDGAGRPCPCTRASSPMGDEPRLLGSHCRHCGARHFPRVDSCPYCGTPDPDDCDLSPNGRLWAWTTVTAAPPGYEGPGAIRIRRGRARRRASGGDPPDRTGCRRPLSRTGHAPRRHRHRASRGRSCRLVGVRPRRGRRAMSAVVISGVGIHPFGRFEDRTTTDLGVTAVRGSLRGRWHHRS